MVVFNARFPSFLLLLLAFVGLGSATTKHHDESFVPDAVLRVTEQVIVQSCLPAKATVLINGTSPGPELRIKGGQTYWIRVYNDMTDKNCTMVVAYSKVSLSCQPS
jgi:L-ascorbate oxidase